MWHLVRIDKVEYRAALWCQSDCGCTASAEYRVDATSVSSYEALEEDAQA